MRSIEQTSNICVEIASTHCPAKAKDAITNQLIRSAISARRAAIVHPAQERSEQMQTATAPIATSIFRVRDFSTWASPLQAIVFA